MNVDHAPERTLPHNLEAERSVLGAVMIDNSAFEVAARHIGETAFFRDAHRRIWKHLAKLLERQAGGADFVTVRNSMTDAGDLEEAGGPAYLASLVDGVPRSTNVGYYAGIVREKAIGRALIYAANRIVSTAYEQDLGIEEQLEQADRAMLDLRHGAGGGRMVRLADTTGELMADLERRHGLGGALLGIDTGFKGINELTFGWQPGDMTIVAARPSMGKTAFTLNTALHCAEQLVAERRRRVAFFSLEMKRKQLEYRLLANLSGINGMRLLSGTLGPASSEEWAHLTTAIERMQECGIHIDDTSSMTVEAVRSELRRLKADGEVDMVVIDYIQLMAGSLRRKGATRTEELADISRRLKVVADEIGCTMLVLSQLRRISGRPKLDDLRESGSLEQDADNVAFLHRANHREDGATEFILEKQRNGPTGTKMITFDKFLQRFVDGGAEPPPETAADQAAEATKEKSRRRARTFAKRAAGY